MNFMKRRKPKHREKIFQLLLPQQSKSQSKERYHFYEAVYFPHEQMAFAVSIKHQSALVSGVSPSPPDVLSEDSVFSISVMPMIRTLEALIDSLNVDFTSPQWKNSGGDSIDMFSEGYLGHRTTLAMIFGKLRDPPKFSFASEKIPKILTGQPD